MAEGRSHLTRFGLALSLLLTGPALAQAQDSVAQFYKGKSVYVVIGSAAGGGFDTYGRLVARHIGKHIPGNPNVVPQNMPGAGGSAAATHVATVAAQDGTYIGAVHPAVIMDPVLGDRTKSKFDVAKLNWIGSANSDTYVCVLRSDAKVKTFADAQATEVILGASSDAASTREFPTLLNNVLGTKFKLVAGYSGNREVMLAVDKNEVQGICGAGWSSVLAVRSQWFTDGTVKVLAQENTFGRPYMMGQNVPKDRVEAIRRAFVQTLKDPELLAEAKKTNLDIEILDGPSLQKIVENIFALDQGVIDKTKKALGYEK